MGEKAKVKETVSLYSKVWQLPTYRGIVLRLALMVIVSSFILSLFRLLGPSSNDFFVSYVHYFIFLGTTASLGSGLLFLVVRKKDSPLDARRTLGSVQFGTLLWFALACIGGLFDLILGVTYIEGKAWLVGLASSYLLSGFLINGLSDYHPIRNFIGAAMPQLVWIVSYFALRTISPTLPEITPLWYIVIPIILIVDSIAIWWIFRAVSKPFERDLGINGPDLLRAFGYDYLMENPTPMEKVLTQIGIKQDIPIEVIAVRDNNDSLYAAGVVLHIHPGPFRDIGSSDLPSAVISHIEQKHAIPAFVFHGACTHHQNLTNKEDFERIFQIIDEAITTLEAKEMLVGPLWEDSGKFKTWTLVAGKNAVVISTTAPAFTDDIALEVGNNAISQAKQQIPELDVIAVVDAHNSIDDDAVSVMPGDPEEQEYIEGVSRGLNNAWKESPSRLKLGIYSMHPENLGIEEGIGPGGIVTLAFISDEKKVGFVTVDGNNVCPGFREKVIDALKKVGYDAAEILTTDTHVVNAVSLSSRGYPPVGSQKPQPVIDSIVDSAKRALNEVRSVTVGITSRTVPDLCTFGERGFDTLTQNIVEAADIAKRIGLAAGGLAFLFSIFLSGFL